MKLSSILFIFVFLSPSAITLAQQNALKFNNYNVRQGLSNNQVSDIVQDKHGFLWIATYNGLNRFDGYSFTTYTDKKELNSNFTTALAQDNDDNLWIGTASGVSRLKLDSYQFDIFLLKEEYNVFIHQLYFDQNQRLWAATDQGIYWFDNQKQIFQSLDISAVTGAKKSEVLQIASDSKGRLWFLSNEGIYLFSQHNEVIKPISLENLFPSLSIPPSINAIYFDDKQQLWLGTSEGEVHVINSENKTLHTLTLPLNNNTLREKGAIRTFQADDNGNIWIATMGKGIFIYYPEQDEVANYHHSNHINFSLADNYIWNIYKSPAGRIWLSTDTNGIVYFDSISQSFEHIFSDPDNPKSIRNKFIWSIFKDSNKQYWIGHEEGVDLLNKNMEVVLSLRNQADENNGLTDNRVLSIVEDSEGFIWFGTEYGLNKYNPDNKKISHYFHLPNEPHTISGNNISKLYIDSQQRLWVSTEAGTVLYQQETDNFKTIKALASYDIYNFIEESKNVFWLATYNRGVLKFNSKSNQVTPINVYISKDSPLSLNNAVSLIKEDNHLWVASLNGLIRVHTLSQKTKTYSTFDGLPSNVIYQILLDNYGFIWGSSSKGIFRLNPQNDNITTFNMTHGVQEDDFTSLGGYKSPEGKLFFGGVNGFNRIAPTQHYSLKQPAKPVLTQLRVLNDDITPNNSKLLTQPIHLTKQLDLTYQQNLFSLAFNSLDYQKLSDIEYNFKLEGFNNSWLQPSLGQPQAIFTNLDPGHYQFSVRARVGQGPWSNSDKLTIHVTPPPWTTWWAYSLYAIILLVFFGSLFWQCWQKQQQRTAYLLDIKKQKERLDVSLWGSGDELWDWDLLEHNITRINPMNVIVDRAKSSKLDIEAMLDYIHPYDIAHVKTELNAHLTGQAKSYEAAYRIQTKSKDWCWVLDRGQIVKRDGHNNPVRFAGTTKNIHSLKVAENDLRQLSQELESRVTNRTAELQNSNDHLAGALVKLKLTQKQLVESEKMASLGNLVVGLSHEINTPLGIAITALSLLREKTTDLFTIKNEGKLSKSYFEKFELMNNETLDLAASNLERTSHLVDNFKKVAVDFSGETEIDFNLLKLLNSSISVAIAKYPDVTFLLDVSCNEHITLCSFPNTLSTVIAELVDNSFDHRVSELIKITLEVITKKDSIQVNYKDNGLGVNDEICANMFEPFFTTKRNQGNTGLGLFIVYNQVNQKLKGTVKYHAQENKGVFFELNIPQNITAEALY
jgi:ligand-binding sensor domain-containing protein/signal transduction histidine kinase